MKGIRRIRQRLCALPLALACLMGLAACGGPDFGSFSKELTFGDKQISDTQTTYVMKIPEGRLGDLIGPSQIQWVIDQYGDPPAHTGAVAVGTKQAAKDLLRKSPELQCRALENTYQEESSDEGKWEYKDSSCRKQRKLSWLEKTLWNMYQVQSDSTIEWLSTSRNTLVAANDTVSTLQANATPNYDSWFAPVNRYLRIAQGVLVAAAAISLIVLSARIVWNIGQGGEGRLLDRIGWILLGVLLGSSCASIALTFFSRSSGGNPDLPSWTPGGGTTFFLSDYIRMQVDPFLIIAAVCGVIAAGWKLVTQQEGRDLIPLGKAFMWAILSAVCLAGLVNTFQATFDTWTADVLRSASGMMNDAWESKSLAASSFFNLGAPVAIVLTIVMWICGLISKIFAYFRAGMLPILVGVAPMWAAMSWMETGKQAFAKTIGWLAAFLAYKPVAALVMATGSAIMATAGPGDDSQAITLMLTLSVIILLPDVRLLLFQRPMRVHQIRVHGPVLQGLETVAHAARHVDRLRRVQTRREHLTERLARAQVHPRAEDLTRRDRDVLIPRLRMDAARHALRRVERDVVLHRTEIRQAQRGHLRTLPVLLEPAAVIAMHRQIEHQKPRDVRCFASMFVRQVRQCFSAVWADGFPRCRHRFPVM